VAGVYGSRLLEKVPRVADIVSFRFKRPEAYRFQAGQWFVITFPGADPAEPWEHHFSHSDSPSDPWMEFTTRMRGSDFKNALDALPMDSQVQLEGPYGAFVMSPNVERAAFLAGGIGVTCVRSIVRWVAAARGGAAEGAGAEAELPQGCAGAVAGAPQVGAGTGATPPAALALREIVLFFANHSEDAIPFKAELEELASSLPGFRVVHVLSRPGERWQGYRGHLSQDILSRELADPGAWQYFVSGPPAFDQAMQAMLVGWGIEAGRIKLERFEGY
jgi:ferredoxin-NADP reductase